MPDPEGGEDMRRFITVVVVAGVAVVLFAGPVLAFPCPNLSGRVQP